MYDKYWQKKKKKLIFLWKMFESDLRNTRLDGCDCQLKTSEESELGETIEH